MKAELIAHLESKAENDFNIGLCRCDKDESKLIYARAIEMKARKTVEAILDDHPRWSK